ncbi:methyl-accepting chemotaxis protein [Haloarcula laminariae]|uniref:methyl-accepting chemotaxis protein n=1 Tax=Haloarcula laminariae TaxID=2961577 RepID=UPI002405824E|nr:methyl-accepting chemotaxis protein [Halomicroarcula sp. FL173]
MSSLRGTLDIRGSYGAKFVLALVTVALLTSGIGLTIYTTVDAKITTETQQHLTATADSEADQLHNWHKLTDQQLVSVTRTAAVRSGDAHQTSDLLTRISERDAIAGTHLVNTTSGTVVVSTGDGTGVTSGGTLEANVSEQLRATANRDGSQTGTTYSDPFRTADGTPAVLVTATTPSHDSRVVLAVVDLARLSEQTVGTHEENELQTTVTVVNASGTVILSSDRETLLTRDPIGANLGQEASGFHTETAGEDVAVAHAQVSEMPWVVTNRQPTSEAYALRNTVSRQILGLVGALLVGLAAIGVTIGRNTIRSVNDLAEKTETLRDGDLDSAIESSRRDEFGAVYTGLDEMRRSLGEKIDEAEVERERAEDARSNAEQAREEAVELNERLESQAGQYSEVMAACADGDLTRRLPTDAETDAMSRIATAYNEMMDEWEATIHEVRSFSEAVQSASSDVSATVASVHDHSEAARSAVVEMADEADHQSEELQTVWSEMESLSATVEEMASTADTVRRRADEALDRSREGRTAATSAADTLDEIAASTDQAVVEVEQLDAAMSDIETVTNLISDIADQTTMLALNANIEAARAETDGDGFAVVADEVKTLADRTVEATGDIESSIERMRGQVERTVEEMHEAQRKVDTGTETVGDALTAFDGIVDDIEAATSGMREIDGVTDEQADSTQEVVSMVETVGDISDRTAEQAGRVADTTTEQASAVERVESDVEQLSERASELTQLLATFEIDGTATAETDVFDPAAAETGPEAATVDGDGTDESTRIVGDGSGD